MDLIACRPNRHTLSAAAAAAAAALVALTVAAIGAAPAAAAPHATIADGGVVRGAAVPGGDVFRGLPYAAAPVGNLRWRAPRPPAAWRGVRDATQFAPSCPQTAQPVRAARPAERGLPLPERLDARRCATTRKRPVLVWIHGGGFTAGRRPQLRRHQARGRRRRRRHDQLPAGRARLPRASGAGLAARRPRGQLRVDGPAGGAALGPAQHRAVRRRPAQRDDRGPVGRRPVGARPARLAADPAASSSGRSCRAAHSR